MDSLYTAALSLTEDEFDASQLVVATYQQAARRYRADGPWTDPGMRLLEILVGLYRDDHPEQDADPCLDCDASAA